LDQLTSAHVQEMISDPKYNHVVPELQQEAAQRTHAIFERPPPTSSEAERRFVAHFPFFEVGCE
jgi:hypothetical protein